MNQTLKNALELVRMAKVQVFPSSVKKRINLFEEEMLAEINFNGYNNLISYQHHLEASYSECKKEIAQDINLGSGQLDELKRQFDLAKFEVKEFRLEKTLKLTPLRRSKLTPFRRSKLTPLKKC